MLSLLILNCLHQEGYALQLSWHLSVCWSGSNFM